MPENEKKPELLIYVNNHFDLTWRRCWQRPLEFEGKTFISYTDIETYYLLDNLQLAQQHPQYKFEIESVLVLQTILKSHPDLLPILQQLSAEGRFAVSGAGETIVDANMIHGESLVRNFVDGYRWVEDTFGKSAQIMLRNDAFGNSAQLPQIARGCGVPCIFGLFYTWPQETYWRGLDGSTVLHRTLPVAAVGGDVVKYPPCAACDGTGARNGEACPECGGRGIPAGLYARLPGEINPEALQEFGAGLVLMGPEELLPNPALLDWAEQHADQYDVRFVLSEELLPYAAPLLAAMDSAGASEFHPSIELNPNNSGVWVSRIKTKQAVRRQEQAMLNIEALFVMAALQGHPYPTAAIEKVRREMYFTMFHDAITATHVDAAYAELLDVVAEIDTGLATLKEEALSALVLPSSRYTVINPASESFTGTVRVQLPWAGGAAILTESGEPLPVLSAAALGEQLSEAEFLVNDLPGFSTLALQIEPALLPVVDGQAEPQTAVIENDCLRVEADQQGILRVIDKRTGKDVLITDEYRPAELILEHDEGSPWATLSPDFTRTPLSAFTRLVRVEKQAAVEQMVFAVSTPFGMGYTVKAVRAELTVRLVRGVERVEFHLAVDWCSYNHRLRVAMPVPRQSDEARYLYEIPFGVVERQPYEPTFSWFGANGDWPAIHWAGVEQPGLSVALFNRGTPSYRMEQGRGDSEVILLSVLRSPAIPTYLHEPFFYTMTDFDGMRDEGQHTFDFAVQAYPLPFSQSPVVVDGEAYQRQLPVVAGQAQLPAMPQLLSEHARIAAVKWAEEDDGMVLRLVEFRGVGGVAHIRVPANLKAAEQVNLLEREAVRLPLENGILQLSLRPWEITTLKLLPE